MGVGEAGEDVVCESTCQWVSAECGAVVAGDYAFSHVFRHHCGADGEAVAERFRGGEDVWVC